MVTAIVGAIGTVLKWLATSAAGKALMKGLAKMGVFAIFLLAMAYAGHLPQSPFRVVIPWLQGFVGQIPYVRYIPFFIPVYEITVALITWLNAVITFHLIKVALRKGGIIR